MSSFVLFLLSLFVPSKQGFTGFSPQAEPFTSKKEIFLSACCLPVFTEVPLCVRVSVKPQMFLMQPACWPEFEQQ